MVQLTFTLLFLPPFANKSSFIASITTLRTKAATQHGDVWRCKIHLRDGAVDSVDSDEDEQKRTLWNQIDPSCQDCLKMEPLCSNSKITPSPVLRSKKLRF
jgi:hypothetical protein